jgi:neutral ceramidase
MGDLLVGIGRATITSPVGMLLMGYINREHGAVAVHDDLVVTAIVLADGHSRVAIVTCDLLMLHASTVEAIRARIEARTGIPPSHVMICCSHTHSGPVTYVVEGAAYPDRQAYLDQLIARVVDAAVRADRSTVPAAWGVGWGTVEIGVNRRQRQENGRTVIGENPAGMVDRELLVLRVDALDSGAGGTRPLLALVNCACHAVCLGERSYLVSADWPGAMRRALESWLGIQVAFIQGACADVNPLGGPQDTYDLAQQLGERVAERVRDLYGGIALRREAHLVSARQTLHLPLLGAAGHAGQPVLRMTWDQVAGRLLGRPREEAVALLDRRFPWQSDMTLRGGVPYACAEVQAILLDDVALAGVAAEPFAEIGLQVKSRSGAARTLFAGYANGCIGYVPVPAAYDRGGYEVDASYAYYRLPAPLAPDCAGILVDGVLSMIATHR